MHHVRSGHIHDRYAQCSENAHPFSVDVQNLHVTKRTFRATLFMQQGAVKDISKHSCIHRERRRQSNARLVTFCISVRRTLCAMAHQPRTRRHASSFHACRFLSRLFLRRYSFPGPSFPEPCYRSLQWSNHPHLASPRLPSRPPFLPPRRMSRGGGGVGGGCG